MTYQNTSEAPSTTDRTIGFQVTDDTLTPSNVATRTVTVTAVDDAPVNTVPGPQTATEDTPLVFSATNGNAISVADVDTAVSGSLSFGISETTKTITVQVLPDTVVEGPETFMVTLSNPGGGATIGSPATITVTIVDTTAAAPAPAPPEFKQDEDDIDKPHKQTEEQHQQHQHTNTGNRDDLYTEGNVVEVHQDAEPPYVVIANKDGLVRVNLLCGDQCPTIHVGDYLEADGEKQDEQLFEATDVTVKHPR